MILVGTFNEQQLIAKEDRKAVEEMKNCIRTISMWGQR